MRVEDLGAVVSVRTGQEGGLSDESIRLEALAQYAILDTGPEPAFDELARLTAAIFRTPIAAVTLVDESRQWFKSSVGLEQQWTPRGDGMCGTVVSDGAPVVVDDLARDPRFAARPLVTGAPHLRFYAGVPLVDHAGQVLGALCVMDVVPRTVSGEQVEILTGLAAQVVAQLELRLAHATARGHTVALAQSEARARRLLEAAPDAVVIADAHGRIEQVNTRALDLFGYTAAELIGQPAEMLMPAALHPADAENREGRKRRRGDVSNGELVPAGTGRDVIAVRSDGSTVPVEVNVAAVDLADGQTVLASIRDVSASRALQRELRIARDGFRDVLNGAVGQAIIAVDLDGRITVFSAGASRMLGYTEGEMLGRSPDVLHDPGEIAARALELGIEPGFSVLVPTDRTSAPDTRLWSYLTRGGGRLSVLVTVTSILDLEGEPTGFITVATDVSDREIAQQRLADSEQRFRLAFDDSRTGMALTSLRPGEAGRFLRVNTALCQLVGHSEQGLLDRGFLDLTHPDDLAETQVVARSLVSGERSSWEVDKRYVHADGHTVWIHLVTSVVTDTDGSPAYAVSQMYDISDRVASIAEVEGRFHELATHVDLGFAIRRHDSQQFHYLNPAFFTVFGFDPLGPAPTTVDILALRHPDDAAAVSRLIETVVDGAIAELEWRIVLPGGVRWIRSRSFLFTGDLDAHDRRVASIFEDITARKLAENEVLASEQRFDQLASSTEVGFFLRTPSEVLYLNRSVLRIFGSDPAAARPSFAEIMGQIHPEDLDLAHGMNAAADRGEPTRADLRIIRADGRTRWIRATNDPVPAAQGELQRVAGTITDITDYKNAELAVLAARRNAEQANAAKDEFLSRMSHELRTPLNAVLGFAQLLEFDAANLSPSHQQGVGHILRGGRHLLAMIDDLLDITSIEANRLELSVEPVDVTALVTDVIGLMQPLADATRVSLRLERHPPAASCWVRADYRRVKQVVINLLSNAIKYNHPGGLAAIDVSLLGEEVRITLSDNGIGIPAHDLSKLFTPFERLGRQRTHIDGSGIGLALSKRLVTVMQGRLDVTSTFGEGSTFTVTLPRAGRPAVETGGCLDATSQPTVQLADPIAVASLLCIEDNPSNRDLMTSVMARQPNWTLTLASTGAAGLDLARAEPPTAIVLDLHLPDLGGDDVLHLLSTTPATAGIPVAILSADASPTRINDLLASGAERYLTKPLDINELFDFLDTHAQPTLATRGPRTGRSDQR